jgi:hypothetical protein
MLEATTMKHSPRIAAFLLVALAIVGSTAGRAQQATLGSNGELYIARAGNYGSLFPKGSPGYDPAIAADHSVLALDIIPAGKPMQRVLVPGTGGTEVENSPSLIFEDTSETLFLVWESRINGIFPVLMLGGLDGSQWLQPVQVNGNPMSDKTSPQIAVTHDSYQLPESTEIQQRTVIHLLWGEENGAGAYETFYAPVILGNGSFIGKTPIYRLNDFDTARVSVGVPPINSALLHALRIQPGRDGQTVVAAFVSPATQRIVSLEIDVLPAQLGMLADDARAHIVDIGRRLSFPAKLQQIADGARAHIIDIGRAFQPEIAASLANQVRDQILASGGMQNLTLVADAARAHIIDIGAKLSGRGLRSLNAESTTLETAEIAAESSTAPALTNLIQFRLASNRPAPQVGQGPISLFASGTGEDLLVAWAQAERVLYVTSKGNEWNAVREILLTDSVDLQRAYAILAQRLSSH